MLKISLINLAPPSTVISIAEVLPASDQIIPPENQNHPIFREYRDEVTYFRGNNMDTF